MVVCLSLYSIPTIWSGGTLWAINWRWGTAFSCVLLYFNHPATLSLSLSLSLSLCALPSAGRNPFQVDWSLEAIQASGSESPVLVAICFTENFRERPRGLLQVPSCPEPCRVVTERCRTWCERAAPAHAPKSTCLHRLIMLLTDCNYESPATSSFLACSYSIDLNICRL